MEIVKLTEWHEEYDFLCDWVYEWWAQDEGWPREKLQEYMHHSVCAEGLPETIVAYENGAPVGMYQLAMQDLDTRPDLYPWLAILFVLPEYRGLGIGKALIEDAKARSKALGAKYLYLYTAHVGLYERFGFRLFDAAKLFLSYKDDERIYVLSLDEEPQH